MIFNHRQILERIERIEERLGRIESAIDGLRTAESLRAELADKRAQMDALAQQSLHVVELLAEAREELARLQREGP